MRNNLAIVGILSGIVVVGALIGWLAGHGPKPNEDHNPLPGTEPPPLVTSNDRPSSSGNTSRPPTPAPSWTNTGINPVGDTNPPPPPANVVTNWEERLDEILSAESDDADKVNQLFDIFPNLPEDGRVEVAQHLSNLIEDENYPRLAQHLENPALEESVLDVLIGDVLNRPNSAKLPLLLGVARNSGHPKAAEAKDLMELYLGEDFGTDWNQWQKKMDDWLKENPD